MFDKSGSTKTLIGIQSGGAGCGSVRYKDAPKWWMRVCISTENIFSYTPGGFVWCDGPFYLVK